MDKKILKKSVCLLTVWIFLLSQFAYAGLYEDIFDLSSGQNIPAWNSSSDWKNPKVKPLYNPEYQQIESTLPPLNVKEGNPESTGILGWLVRNIIEPVVNFFKSFFKAPSIAPPQTTPTPPPTLSPEAQKNIERWIVDLGSSDPEVQKSAEENLIKSDLQAVDLLIEALTDKKQSPEVKMDIAYIFSEMASQGGLSEINKRKAVVESLVPFLRAEPVRLRWHTYNALRKIGGAQAEDAIKQARVKAGYNWFLKPGLKDITSSDLEKRVYAARYLGASGDPRAVKPLLTALGKETNQSAKWEEICALGELGIIIY